MLYGDQGLPENSGDIVAGQPPRKCVFEYGCGHRYDSSGQRLAGEVDLIDSLGRETRPQPCPTCQRERARSLREGAESTGPSVEDRLDELQRLVRTILRLIGRLGPENDRLRERAWTLYGAAIKLERSLAKPVTDPQWPDAESQRPEDSPPR